MSLLRRLPLHVVPGFRVPGCPSIPVRTLKLLLQDSTQYLTFSFLFESQMAQAGLSLTKQPGITLNFGPTCFHLSNAKITGIVTMPALLFFKSALILRVRVLLQDPILPPTDTLGARVTAMNSGLGEDTSSAVVVTKLCLRAGKCDQLPRAPVPVCVCFPRKASKPTALLPLPSS